MTEKRESYRPANGTDGADFMARWCNRCACDPEELEGPHDGCPILADSFALEVDAEDYPPELVEVDGVEKCTAFVARPQDWDGVPLDPYAVQKKAAAYDALPRDPVTGRPVI